jgi:type VII secretion protein EccB
VASRRDQLQSYQFLTQRVISAFVMRETDPAQSPLRRGIGAVFVGLMVAVMVAAGYGVVGLLTKSGSKNWKTDGAVVIEKETGASFLYSGGVLHPMLNFTSALLASGKPASAVFRIASNSLAGTPRGSMLGIAGAPDSLPARGKELKLPWTLCSTPTTGGTRTTTVTLLVGQGPQGAQDLGAQGMLVQDTSNNSSWYLIWQNRRYLLRSPTIVVPALFGAASPTKVGKAWLNGIPEGSDIGPIPVGDRKGQPSTRVPSHKVGDLVTAQTGTGKQFYVVLDDGLAPINELQKDIFSAQYAVQPVEITLNEATTSAQSTQLKPPSGDTAPPQSPPHLVSQTPLGQTACATTRSTSAPPTVSTGGAIDQSGPGTATGSTSDSGTSLADRVVVPGGHVAVVRAVESPNATTGAYYVVTDVGVRFAVPDDKALQTLGYQPSDAVNVLAGLVLRVPAGPALDPDAALKPASTGAGGS